MIRYTIVLLLTFCLFSCSNDDDNSDPINLIGQWRLYEQLADPGDGSGVFRAIDSDKTLKFFTNGVITSQNGSLCEPYSNEQITTGTYSITENKITTNCQNPSIATISFEIVGDDLILNFISIEGFSQKFRKIL
ncbi:lipocalin family protein [Aquimarina sp. AU474]|uniref:lipocalin family protein n=1 Tax=Aquimarina sp. AU474 TaxID=2108529 RepID=UPI001358CC9F|nr:lipocalin family protein [Aquimarina sp. AU474]